MSGGAAMAFGQRWRAASAACLMFGFECEPLSTREESSEAYVEASYERLQQCLLVWENTTLPLSSDFEKLVDSATVFRNGPNSVAIVSNP